MKIKSMVLWGAVFMLSGGLARAAHIWDEGYWSKDDSAPLYASQEFQFDLFGTYNNPEGKFNDLFETNIRHGVWGGGAGVNYFFTPIVGIGTDFAISDYDSNDWKFNYWLGDLYLRLPIASSGLAPYLVGSGGRGITPVWQWEYGGGVGLEFRFDRRMGIFSDARFLWSDKETALNSLVFRAGLRLSF